MNKSNPFYSPSCKRQQNVVKNQLQVSLKLETLNALMQVSLCDLYG
jgi:hypothetical protein